jgi:hypothetical protein
MLVLAMQFSRDGVRPKASGKRYSTVSVPPEQSSTASREAFHAFPGGTPRRADRKGRRAGALPHNRAVKPDRMGLSVVLGR